MTATRTRVGLALAVATVAGVGPVAAADAAGPALAPLDRHFAVHAAMSDQLEIRSSRAAARVETGAPTRRLAQMLIRDHTRSSTLLKRIARPLGVHLPARPSPVGLWAIDQLNLLARLDAAGPRTGGSGNAGAACLANLGLGSGSGGGAGTGSAGASVCFERAYLSLQVQAHVQTIAEFREELQFGENAGLRSFAARQLPVLRRHLAMATSALRAASR